MSDDLKAYFQQRAKGDETALANTFRGNVTLSTLLNSINDLKGKGFSVKVGSLQAYRPEQDGEVYKAPSVYQKVTVTHNPGTFRANRESELTVSFSEGQYGFTAEGDVTNSYDHTNVGSVASNTVQQWLLDVQTEYGIDILSTAMARHTERHEAQSDKPRAKPA